MLVRRPHGGLGRPGENVYTDPTLLDVGGALEALPDLSLDGPLKSEADKAAGTHRAQLAERHRHRF